MQRRKYDFKQPESKFPQTPAKYLVRSEDPEVGTEDLLSGYRTPQGR